MKPKTSSVDLATTVHQRTPLGRSELFAAKLDLSDFERRYLSVVTGITPQNVLMNLMFEPGTPKPAVERLVAEGLIELIQPSPGKPQRKRSVELFSARDGA